LLIAGVLAALFAFAVQRDLSGAASQREAELEELRRMSRRALPAIEAQQSDTPEVREQIKKANLVLAQMNVPWSELFGAIESAQDKDVALLAVQPDARSRAVLIGGQARSLPAVFGYMERLERSERLVEVVLATHEIEVEEAGQPVSFSLQARWLE
jgi:hypothetical protein